jgi:hypothetical protein
VLAFTAVITNDAASYSVTITNAAGSVTSAGATLTVLVSPIIVTPPMAVSAVTGSNVTFSITASGTAPLTYQWQKNGVNLANGGKISGATSATLNLTGVSPTDAGSYAVIVANSAGSVTSASAPLAVLQPPAITTQPASQFGALGSAVSLSVTASGTGPLNYQWFNATGALTDAGNISGATTAALAITALTTNEVGNYFVVVSNAYGTATSATASISVNISPIITTQPANQYAAVTSNVTFTAAAAGSAPFSYQWFYNGKKLANSKSVSGATTDSLTLLKVATTATGGYSVVIKNNYGSVTSVVAQLSVLIPPNIKSSLVIKPTPKVVTQSVGSMTRAGTNVIFSVSATGSAPLTYQWYKNSGALTDGGNISGSATSTLKVTSVTTNDSGVYAVVVSNPVGKATSTSTLMVVAPPVITAPPVSQAVTVGSPAAFSVTNSGTAPFTYQWFRGTKPVTAATNSVYSIGNVTTNYAGGYFVVINNFAGSVTSAVASLTILLPPTITTPPASVALNPGATANLSAVVAGTAPFTYQWLKNGLPLTDGGKISGSLTSALTIVNVTSNDAGIYSLAVTNAAGGIVSAGASLSVVPANGGGGGGGDGGNDNLRKSNVTARPVTISITQILRATSGTVTLDCSGANGSNYIMQASADLRNWSAISTNTADAAGQWQVNDPAAAEQPIRFYRVATP